jgi:amino acid transporter
MPEKQANKGTIGLWEAVSMAVGTMIGASIFSIFGLGAEIAGQNLPEAFLLSGLYAFIVAYSYAKLGTKIISNSGPIAFIIEGIGDGLVTGALSVMMWLTYVVSIAMFAKGFAGYFLPLLKINKSTVNTALVEVFVIVFFTILNFFGSKAVGKTEFYIVLVKVSILVFFISIGVLSIKSSYIQPRFDTPHLTGMLHASVIFFLSYMGFGLITSASENIKDASKNIPKAIYISIAVVLFIYVFISLSAVGNLTQAELLKARENALAIAAKPFLGQFGFLLVSIGALFSISSALNATLYGGANISYSLAKNGDLPDFFERKIWFKSVEGLYITAALSAAFALFFDMSGIASITSSIFTLIYIFVIVSHFRLRKNIGGNTTFLGFNIVLLSALFFALLFFQFSSQKMAFFGTFAVIVGAIIVEASFRFLKNRSFSSPAKKWQDPNNHRIFR